MYAKVRKLALCKISCVSLCGCNHCPGDALHGTAEGCAATATAGPARRACLARPAAPAATAALALPVTGWAHHQ